MKKPIAIAVLMVAIAAAAFLMQNRQANVSNEPVQNARPVADDKIDFTLADLDGNSRSLSEWRGQALLVNFWATWCAPCRREIPLLKQTQSMQAENKLQILGIAVDFKDDVLRYAEEADFNYPILIGQQDAIDAAEASGIEFVGMPFTLVIDADGMLLNTHIGEIEAVHIERIVAVVAALESGEMDLEAARTALHDL